MGDAIATNLFLLGYAWQKSMVPVSLDALMQAIELNAVAVDMNKKAFLWGRRAAHDCKAVERIAQPATVTPIRPKSLDDMIEQRARILVEYQDAAYANRYRQLVERVRAAETHATGGASSNRLTEAVVRAYFKLLAYKDEYEVARLYNDPAFWDKVDASFEGDYQIRFQLAPPLLARPDPVTGRIHKQAFGPRMRTVFRWLAKLKGLRGTRLDIFGHTEERKAERALIAQYERDLGEIVENLSFLRLPPAVEIARLPEQIRGFGHIKLQAIADAAAKREQLLKAWRAPASPSGDADTRAA
jgi:indolepyruvate ferredoxin oxidoreductase